MLMPRSSKLIDCPFEVRIDGASHDKFYDVRDAIASAHAVKRANPESRVAVADTRTGKTVLEIGGKNEILRTMASASSR